METKYYVGRTWHGGENFKTFAVYRAQWEGKILLKEEIYPLHGKEDWKPTKAVSRWFFVGNDEVDPCSKEEAEKLLPKGVSI